MKEPPVSKIDAAISRFPAAIPAISGWDDHFTLWPIKHCKWAISLLPLVVCVLSEIGDPQIGQNRNSLFTEVANTRNVLSSCGVISSARLVDLVSSQGSI